VTFSPISYFITALIAGSTADADSRPTKIDLTWSPCGAERRINSLLGERNPQCCIAGAMSSSIPPSSSPPVQSAKVHIVERDGSSIQAQMRIRLSSALTFADLCHLAEQRYFKRTGVSFTICGVEDIDGNEFSLDDPVDQLHRDEVAYIIVAPPVVYGPSGVSSPPRARVQSPADSKPHVPSSHAGNDITLLSAHPGTPTCQASHIIHMCRRMLTEAHRFRPRAHRHLPISRSLSRRGED